MSRLTVIALCIIGILPLAANAQQSSSGVGPDAGDREFSISGTGSSDDNFENGSFGLSFDLGWYLTESWIAGIRQSGNYASVEGENLSNDFWNGSTRGYLDYQFDVDRLRPFLGASLGGVYGDGIPDSAFAGLELGMKFYVRNKTYILGRAEYQWFFEDSNDADDTFEDGAFVYTLGLGYNF